MHNLGTAYRSLGKYAQADALYTAALEARRKALGEEHWATQNTRLGLAISYRAQGRYLQAEPLFLLATRNTARALGPEHALTLQMQFHTGELYRRQRRFGEADAIFEKVLEARRRVLGPDNPYTAQVMASLGEMRLDQHSYADAEKLLREALQIRQQKRPDDWERYHTESMLGATLWARGKSAEARSLLTSGYHGMLKQQGSIPAEYRPALQEARDRASQALGQTVTPANSN
jgi:tetratricopeptide (TPR) repeat protein